MDLCSLNIISSNANNEKMIAIVIRLLINKDKSIKAIVFINRNLLTIISIMPISINLKRQL